MADKYRFDGSRSYNYENNSTSLTKMSKSDSKDILKKNIKRIREIQDKLFAEKKQAFLFVFQAMDAAGKDGTIKHVFSGINPQGIEVSSFKKPTEEEIQHDFLWRVHKKVPQKGMIGIFNRSHYEEVLVTRVHPEYLKYQNLRGIHDVEDISDDFWISRFNRINSFEDQLTETGTTVVKFFLNVSMEEQKRRLLSRIENTDKNWKFNLNDFKERDYWKSYQSCFEDMINNTSTEKCPWFVIPADDKNAMRALVSSKIVEILEENSIEYPSYSGDFEADKFQALSLLENDIESNV